MLLASQLQTAGFTRSCYSRNQKSPSTTSRTSNFTYTKKPVMLRFGFASPELKEAGKNGIWATIEGPETPGGVGSVSKAVLLNFATDPEHNRDLRGMHPYYKPLVEADNEKRTNGKDKLTYHMPDGTKEVYPLTFEDTGLSASILLFNQAGKDASQEVRLLQKFIPVLENGQPVPNRHDPNHPMGYWDYAIDHAVFRAMETPYSYGKTTASGPDALDQDPHGAQQKSLMLFTKAAAQLIPQLGQKKQQEEKPGKNFKHFEGPIDFVIAHDWHVGPLWNELPKDFRNSIGNVFGNHNHYDQSWSECMVHQLALNVPARQALIDEATGEPVQVVHPFTGEPQPQLTPKGLSCLASGIDGADTVFIDLNYANRLENNELAVDPRISASIKKARQDKRLAPMHHALPAGIYNPLSSPKIAVHLKEQTPEAVAEFKAQNKQVVQKICGLKEDPSAILIMNAGRNDPNQKGTYLMVEDAERILKAPGNEHVQMFFNFTDKKHPPRMVEWAEKLQSDPALQGRIKINLGGFIALPQYYAASDFFMLPSLYEPYGQTQLEAMSMGCVPVAHGVDGIKSTVYDPEMIENNDAGVPDAIKPYGQTGILMAPVNTKQYQQAIAYEEKLQGALEKLPWHFNEIDHEEGMALVAYVKEGLKMPKEIEATLQQARNSFQTAMNRAIQVAKDPQKLSKMRMNGMKFVQERHNPQAIIKFYDNTINHALERRDTRRKSGDKASLIMATPTIRRQRANENEPVGQKLAAFA